MKNLFIFTLVVLTSISCGKYKTDSTYNNERLIQNYFEHFNNHEWERMANMYAPTAEFIDPSLGAGIVKQTRRQTIDKYAALHRNYPDLHDQVIRTYSSGKNHIIVEFISTGTAPGELRFSLPICTIFTIENGKIIKDFTYFDIF